MSKRSSPSWPSSSGGRSEQMTDFIEPPRKLLAVGTETISFSRVRSLEELDKRTLQLQNKKLCEALSERRAAISDLRERIEQLETRQAKDDALLCTINRYWDQLDEDCLLLLQRCENDVEEDVSTSTESFLKQLASWDKEEVPEKLQERVHFSKRIIARLLSAFDRISTRYDRLRSSMLNSEAVQGHAEKVSTGGEIKEHEAMDQKAKEELTALTSENSRLQNLCTNMHSKYRQNNLKLKELQDLCQARSDSAAEWQAKFEDLEYKLNQSTSQIARLDHRLYDAQQAKKTLEEEVASLKGTGSPATSADNDESTFGATSGSASIAKSKYNDLVCELEEQKELATNRLSELERLQRMHEEKVAECVKLSMQMHDPPESLIQDAPTYKSLKVQFNILYNEVILLRNQLEEARATEQSSRHSHLKQIEEMEANETAILNQMRTEMLSQEESYSQLRREYETLEADFKQAVAHNEQAGSISSEMRSLISTLQTQNKQFKAEVTRYRRKAKEATQDYDLCAADLKATEEELTSVRSALSEATAAAMNMTAKLAATPVFTTQLGTSPTPFTVKKSSEPIGAKVKQASDIEATPKLSPAPSKADSVTLAVEKKARHVVADCSAKSKLVNVIASTPPPFDILPVKQEPTTRDPEHKFGSSLQTAEDVKELRAQLKASQEAQKEMSVLLNMYKVIPKDQRDKASLLQAEAKLRSELTEARAEIIQLQTIVIELQQQHVQTQKRLQTSAGLTVDNASASSHASKSDNVFSFSPSASPSVPQIPGASHTQFSSLGQQSAPSALGTLHIASATLSSPASGSTLLKLNVTASPMASSPVSSLSSAMCDQLHAQTATAATGESDKRVWQVAELQLEGKRLMRKCMTFEEQLNVCQQRLVTAKQQEDVLLKEIEVTGQAFEDVQEHNNRLVHNLREKDDANLKQMTEWMKTGQLARLLKEDKKLLDEQTRLMQAKIEALNRTIQKHEDKERLLLTNLSTLEKEAVARQQSQESYKRKSIECQQVAEDLRVTVQKYHGQLKEAQTTVQEKAAAFEQVSFRHQRLQEELVTIRRKYERLRKIEQSHNADEVLLAEIQDYKEQLTCPTCKTNKKDAILTKCFHVFCLNCLKARYETRNRKCPKCNATFGANDYHRIYLT